MPKANSKIKFIEPKLRAVRPKSALAMKIFGTLNVVLGFSLYFQTARTHPSFFIINHLLDYQFWGVIYFSVGVLMLSSYIFNSWAIMRWSLLASLAIEFYWSFAFIVRQLIDPGENIILAILFATLAAVQIVSFIAFPVYKKFKLRKQNNE